ncbi:hypothetical protein EW093_13900 [Thiospirochaeta perfilievii]|uniref:Uncharacterized protein n=1 Tax=Thiospirochaeta perfilievii TaxID=252967 RepID=A0A5C1QF59_9SPIO|nr:hypothetical protein [Thiospirochaeta perfilievii]QEN05750.1 hypothetical protein EW093_13900 [Thiospirochaeta perfilievii]
MKVIRIIDIIRKDVPLYYRNKYTAIAEIEISSTVTNRAKIEFAIEVTPISGKVYSVDEIEDLDYPTLPVKKALVEEIKNYDREGLLP